MRLPFGARWWELIPDVLLVAGLALFALTETSAATSAFGSTKAIVLMAVVTVAWVGGRLLMLRHTHWPALRLVVFSVAALAILKVVVFPAYDDTTVVEALPVAAVVPSTASTALPSQPAAVTPTTVAVPEVIRTGAVDGIDHRAVGTARLYRQGDGTFTVGLEDIDIQPGPDYDVFVVPGSDRQDKDGGTRLDDLRGNKGTQYYAVPESAAVDAGEWTVLVWCQTFDVPVANATLT